MIYAFILGRIFTLSVAELLSVFERENMEYRIIASSADVLILDLARSIKDEQRFLDNLGGIIKIIEVLGEENKVSDLKNALAADKLINHYPNIKPELENIPSVKFYWGLSVYFICDAQFHTEQKIVKQIQSYMFGVKEALRERLMKCRIVAPPPGKFALDASMVEKNNLLRKGGEIVVLADKKKTYWGKTLAIQNFRFYGLRDYGRPARSMKVGMMPPKLAQVMINLSQAPVGEKILDPFCGTGVVLQEAMLMNYGAIGADNEQKTISLAKENLEWLLKIIQEKGLKNEKKKEFELFQADARKIGGIVPKNSISAIVTEGTLGPRYGRVLPNSKQIKDNFTALEILYLEVFSQFKSVLKKDARVVITFPVYFLKGREPEFAPFLDKIKQLGYNTVCPVKAEISKDIPLFSLSKNGTIVYSRPDQNVGREIVIFIKK